MAATNETIEKRKINVMKVSEFELKQKKIRVSENFRKALEE